MSLLTQKLAEHHCLALQVMGADISSAQLLAKVTHLAEDLKNQQIKPQDRVALRTEDPVRFFSGMMAIRKAGGIVVNLNPTLNEAQQSSILKQTKSRFILGDGLHKTNLPMNKVPEPPPDTALIQFTSGSTGTPKGVCLSEEALIQNAIAAAKAIGLKEGDKLFLNTPVHFTSAIAHFLMCLCTKATLIAEPGFYFPNQIAERIKYYNATVFGGAPYHLFQFANTIDKAPETLRLWISSGDHLTKATHLKAFQLFPKIQFFSFYGLTEVAGRLCVLDPKHIISKAGSAGKNIEPMQVQIRREDGTLAGVGESGEIHTKGPLLMQSYLGQSTSNEFATGDIGYLDKDGFLWLEGRKDDIFKSGAEKVSTIRIQQALMDMGICEDVAVVGVQNDYLGKVPYAFVVAKTNHKIRPRTIIGSLRKVLPQSHVPKHVVAMEEIPRTGSGKIMRKELTNKAKNHG